MEKDNGMMSTAAAHGASPALRAQGKSILDAREVTIEVSGLELFALKKLSLVSHALAGKLQEYKHREEQKCLATVLDDVIRRIELNEPRGLSAAEGPVGRRVDTPTPSEDIP